MVATLAGVLAVWSTYYYIKGMLYGGARPNAVSFFLWTVLQAIAFGAQIKKGASWSAVFVFFMALDTAIVTVLTFVGYGYRKYGKTELYCFIFATVAIVLLLVGDPVFALLFSIVGDIFAFYPTVVKTYREPRSEPLTAWMIGTAASVLGVLSTEVLDTANLAFPVYQVLVHIGIISLAYFRGKRIVFE